MKMKRVLACALSAAMIVTFVSFGNMGVGMVHAAVDIENESVTVEEKVLKEIESEVLKANAKANSEQKPAAWDNDGEAGWAFDDENHWWHSRYQGNPVEGEVNSGLVSASNPIWIQTGFGEAKKIKKITYLSRDNGMGSINAYKVQYANVQQGEPRDDDFHDIAGAAGNLQNARTAQEIVFNEAVTATHIRLVATSIYANGGQQYVAAKRIRVFEETEGTEGVTYNFYKESDFWDYEVAYGNLADQTENADRWHYQIKKPSEGGWIDIPANALKTKDNGEKSWMNDDKGLDGTYYYAKLNKDEITSTFQGEAYTAVAYAWKAPKNGYFKMTLESPITQASSPAPSFFVCHSSDNQDGKDLFRNIVGANSTITSKIARVHTGEWLRLGATTKNAWASGLKPVVMEVTAKDYAVQYLEEVSGIEEGNSYTEASKQAVKEARSALQEAILPEVPDMVVVEQKITALEQAIAGLQEYVPVTEVTLNVTEANLKVGETVQLTAIVAPDNASQEVLWVSDAEGIASVDSATGLVTANSAGTAIITATSTMNPEKKAQCTVVVTRDDTALDVAIKAAEEKIREENFENKYTEASKTALRENLENAKLAKENANLSVEDVKLVVDALNASLSSDIVSSTPFLLELLNMQVMVDKGETKTLSGYLMTESSPWWSYIIGLPSMFISGVKSLFTDEEELFGERQQGGVVILTEKEKDQIDALKKNITAIIDKKTAITNVSVTLQNPKIAAVIADSVVHRLQEHIIGYRTSKAKEDCVYLEKLFEERKQEYYATQKDYAEYVDTHDNLILQSVRAEQERLQNDMSLAYQVYSQVANQLQVARAKVQEEKPVFAVVEPAVVPLKASGLGLKVYVLLFVFLFVFGTISWILMGRNIFNCLRKNKI